MHPHQPTSATPEKLLTELTESWRDKPRATAMAATGRPSFRGRVRERAVLDGLLDGVREGRSAALVLQGEAGIGKTELLHYCARQAAGCRVRHIAVVESEVEMPFAAVHQLCRPLLADLGALSPPQQQALRIAFGLAAGDAPDRFVVGLAVLGLLAEAAAKRPLVCLVDDAQWLDEPSRQVLAFVGRRLLAEAVLLVFAVREAGHDHLVASLPSVTLTGLSEDEACALLAAAVPSQLDEQVRDRMVTESGGNPRRLLELPRGMRAAELAGGFGAPDPDRSFARLEEHYAQRLRALPEPTRQLLLLAAADCTGDATLLWRAALTTGVPRSAAAAAESAHLLHIGSRVGFRDPLVRSAAYAAASADDRRTAHAALAAATDAEMDPERHVWHLAAAATGPDESVALQLEQAADAAQARAGVAAAAAFLQRSVELTAGPEQRAERALAAARAHVEAGSFEAARALLAEARALATSDLQRARIERLRGMVQFASNSRAEAPLVLVQAARALEPLDPKLARETYLDAWNASFAAGSLARPGGLLPEVSLAARAAPPARDRAPASELLLQGLATVVTDGRAAGAPTLRRAVEAFLREQVSEAEFVRWGSTATLAATMLWDCQSWGTMVARHVSLARASGALAALPIALDGYGLYAALSGDLDATTALVAEYNAVIEAVEIEWQSVGSLLQAAYQGRPEALEHMSDIAAACGEHGAGRGRQLASWTTSILCNGLGRYADALAAAQRAAYEIELPDATGWALPELIEAAVRTHEPDVACDALQRLTRHTLPESDWAMGLEARCRAIVAEGAESERWYVEAVTRLARTPFRTEVARARLLYGEWLRREGRRIDAREHLAPAHDMFVAMGADAFAERARRELIATGGKVRKRSVAAETRDELTPQEEHVARLARDGRSNAEISAELFLSVRTVEWHLRKVFQKLAVSSRHDLKHVLPSCGVETSMTGESRDDSRSSTRSGSSLVEIADRRVRPRGAANLPSLRTAPRRLARDC
jgi:DNA-binding CsgD family transcriptional regulator